MKAKYSSTGVDGVADQVGENTLMYRDGLK